MRLLPASACFRRLPASPPLLLILPSSPYFCTRYKNRYKYIVCAFKLSSVFDNMTMHGLELAVGLTMALILFASADSNQTTTSSPSPSQPQNTSTPAQGPDFDAVFGIAKGIANGDFVRNLLESAGVQRRTANGTRPDIPWPRQGSELINLLQKYLSRFLLQVEKSLQQAVDRSADRVPQN
jgi:hypothetical protein